MGHSKALAIGFCGVVALGCQTMVGQVQRSLRSPGEKLASVPDEVWSQYDCAAQSLPLFKLEDAQLVPDRVVAGENVNHRMVYALCPTEPTTVIEGALQTRIMHKGRPVRHETDAHYEIKPGRWVVDTFIRIPREAESGIYSVEVQFESANVSFREERSFAVEQH